MILFKEDFLTQRAIVDTETKNSTFIKMGILLKRMGIENNMFFLALTQPEIQKYDPHHLTDNSEELRQRIALECKLNPWYYFREVIRVGASGSNGIPYILNRANLAQAWAYLNCLDSYLTMPRQLGKTFGAIGTGSWLEFFAGNHITLGLFAKDAKLAQENVSRLKDVRDNLPKYLLEASIADTNNKEGISYAALANQILTFVAQKDKGAAEGQGRGQTLAFEHWDELEYYENNWISFATAQAAMGAAKPQCIASGCPSGTMITTTAGDLDDPKCRFGCSIIYNSMMFHEKLYDCRNRDELLNVIDTNCSNRTLYMEYSYKQIGKTDEWFFDTTRNMSDKRKIEKEYLNRRTPGSSTSLFPPELLIRASDSVKEPVAVTYYESLVIRWYQHPKMIMEDPSLRNKPYIMASDTSDNVGRDYTTFIMVDPYDLSPVAEFKCNMTNMAFVTRAIKKFIIDFPRSIFIPERNKNGAMMLDFLLAMLQADTSFSPFTRVYNEFCQDYTSDTPSFRTLDLASGLVRKKFGFTTGAGSRDTLYSSVLTTAVQLTADRFYSATLVSEIKGLVKRNGRIDHSIEGHDDSLIAYLLCVWFAIFGRNHHMYGIKSDELLSLITEDGASTDKESKQRTLEMRARGNELVKLILKANNSIVRNAYQRELDKIKAYLDEDFLEEDKLETMAQVTEQATKGKPVSNTALQILSFM